MEQLALWACYPGPRPLGRLSDAPGRDRCCLGLPVAPSSRVSTIILRVQRGLQPFSLGVLCLRYSPRSQSQPCPLLHMSCGRCRPLDKSIMDTYRMRPGQRSTCHASNRTNDKQCELRVRGGRTTNQRSFDGNETQSFIFCAICSSTC